MDFSQRMGLVPVKTIQINDIDLELKNSIWNILTACYFSNYRKSVRVNSNYLSDSNFHQFAIALYSEFYKAPIDTLPTYWKDFLSTIRKSFFQLSWHKIYSLVEFIPNNTPLNLGSNYAALINRALEKESSAYRFVAGKITEITSPEEIEEVENAILSSCAYAGVTTHLQTSLGLLTDRQRPDYRNSIKESISAVESLAKHLVGNPSATLDGALKVLEKSHKLHPALKKAFSSLYGYTNDSDGIRHALMENSELTQADARFMLITCSAFINFAIDSTKS